MDVTTAVTIDLSKNFIISGETTDFVILYSYINGLLTDLYGITSNFSITEVKSEALTIQTSNTTYLNFYITYLI
jgi:hypothetical protein